jgi:SAM-dependent methyltransferase
LFTDDDHFFHQRYLTDERADAEVAEILSLVALDEGARILDAGCGDGRIAVRLAAEGFRVTGIDHDAAQLTRCRARADEHGVVLDLREGTIADAAPRDTFDAAVLWFNTYGFLDDAGNEATLEALAGSVRPGGMVVIDTLNRWSIERDLEADSEPVVVRFGAESQTDQASFDASTGRLITERIVERGGRVSRRVLSIDVPSPVAWPQLLGEHGLEVCSITGRAGRPVDEDDWALVIAATRWR